jgi:hypothetical protein
MRSSTRFTLLYRRIAEKICFGCQKVKNSILGFISLCNTFTTLAIMHVVKTGDKAGHNRLALDGSVTNYDQSHQVMDDDSDRGDHCAVRLSYGTTGSEPHAET